MEKAEKMKSLFVDVDHIGIKAYELERAVKFYTDVLGFTLLHRMKPGEAELVFLQLGSTVVELVEVVNGSRFEDGVVNHVALKVSDIFTAVDLLKKEGVEFITPEPMPIGERGYNFFFRGPSGEKLELFQG